mgnify:CR=1 FL=1
MRKEIQEWIEKGNRTEAVRLLEEWVGKHPADEEEWLLLGELLYADGKMTEALNKFNTVLRLNPDHRKAANYVIMINNILGMDTTLPAKSVGWDRCCHVSGSLGLDWRCRL